jgi:hypothetical protein
LTTIATSEYHRTAGQRRDGFMLTPILKYSFGQCSRCKHWYNAWLGRFDPETREFFCSLPCAIGLACGCVLPVSDYVPDPPLDPAVIQRINDAYAALTKGGPLPGRCNARKTDGGYCKIPEPCWYHP